MQEKAQMEEYDCEVYDAGCTQSVCGFILLVNYPDFSSMYWRQDTSYWIQMMESLTRKIQMKYHLKGPTNLIATLDQNELLCNK